MLPSRGSHVAVVVDPPEESRGGGNLLAASCSLAGGLRTHSRGSCCQDPQPFCTFALPPEKQEHVTLSSCPPVFLSQTVRRAAPSASANPQTFNSSSGPEEAPGVSGVRSRWSRRTLPLAELIPTTHGCQPVRTLLRDGKGLFIILSTALHFKDLS